MKFGVFATRRTRLGVLDLAVRGLGVAEAGGAVSGGGHKWLRVA